MEAIRSGGSVDVAPRSGLLSKVLRVVLSLGLGGAGLALTAAVASAPASATGVWSASNFSYPSDLSENVDSGLSDISCVDPADCIAVGTYESTDAEFGGQAAWMDVETAGTWSDVDTTNFGNGWWTGPGNVDLAQVSCPPGGALSDCVILGMIYHSYYEAMAVTDQAGTWTATPLPNPRDNYSYGQGDLPRALSCAAVGWCTAEASDSVTGDALVETLSGGSWTPSYVSGMADFQGPQGLSCPSIGVCFLTSQSGIWTGTGGTWTEPPGSVGNIGNGGYPIDCTSDTSCTVAGYVEALSSAGMIVETLSGGSWTTSDTAAPTPAPPGEYVSLAGAPACSAPGTCVLVGNVNGNNYSVPVAYTVTGGAWGEPETLPTNPSDGDNVALAAVWCGSSTDCEAVGESPSELYAWNRAPDVDPPDAPTIGTATAQGDCGDVTFTVPTDNGAGITSFTTTTYQGGTPAGNTTFAAGALGSSTDPTPGASDSVLVCGLTGGDDYTFTVSATNADGQGPASAQSNQITAPILLTPTVVLLASSIPAAPSPVPYTVTVSGTGPTPTGSVTVSDSADASCTVTLGSGTGTCDLTEGGQSSLYDVTASYGGDATYAGGSATINVANEASSGTAAGAGSVNGTAEAYGGTAGVDTVTYADYPGDPEAALSNGVNYFDVSLSADNTFTSMVVSDCVHATPATTLEWWDAAAGTGGAWEPVVGDPGPSYVAGTPACTQAVLDGTTSPTLAQLSGTPFAMAPSGTLTVTTTALPAAQRGVAYSATLTASGGNPPYKWTLPAGTLPAGLHLSSAGVISGTPATTAALGTDSFTVQVATSHPTATATQSLSLAVGQPSPTVTTVSPSSGPGAGGTKVTIDGTALEGTSAVAFGGLAATSYSVNGAGTKITAYAPAQAAGAVTLSVTTPGGTADASYTYLGPTITTVAPSSAPGAGGTKVTISGSGFQGTSAVDFGALAATSYSVNGAGTKITAYAPAQGGGAVTLTVTTPGGTADTTYTYQ